MCKHTAEEMGKLGKIRDTNQKRENGYPGRTAIFYWNTSLNIGTASVWTLMKSINATFLIRLVPRSLMHENACDGINENTTLISDC